MSKNKPVIVVEGVSDINRLQNIVDADFVSVNGSAVSKEILDYIKELVKTREVIVLTDPDYPGLRIRKIIAEYVPEVKHAYVDRKKSSNGKKLGVAECQEDEIKYALANYVSLDRTSSGEINLTDFARLGLTGLDNSSDLRAKVAEYFHVGYGNAKTICKRLNMLGITLKELEDCIHDM